MCECLCLAAGGLRGRRCKKGRGEKYRERERGESEVLGAPACTGITRWNSDRWKRLHKQERGTEGGTQRWGVGGEG